MGLTLMVMGSVGMSIGIYMGIRDELKAIRRELKELSDKFTARAMARDHVRQLRRGFGLGTNDPLYPMWLKNADLDEDLK